MTDLRTAAQQALEALESTQLYCAHEHYPRRRVADAITALRAALEQPEQEPVAWANMKGDGTFALLSISQHQEDRANWMHPVPLYTHPPCREWRGLTEEDIWTLAANCLDSVLGRLHFARAIEAALRSKNYE
jgi:hypothetical protein